MNPVWKAQVDIPVKMFTDGNNAGDVFAGEIVNQFFNGKIQICGETSQKQKNLLLVGSIISWADENSVVVGSGFNAANETCNLLSNFVAVRGPLTNSKLIQLGYNGQLRHCDLGVLAGEIYPDYPETSPIHKIGIVPHYADKKHPWVLYWKLRGAKVIDIQAPVSDVLREIAQCENIISSSLHGIIFAHSMGRNASWIQLSEKVHGGEFKFYDYYLSLPKNTKFELRTKVSLQDSPKSLVKLANNADLASLVSTAKESVAEAVSIFSKN